MNQTTQDFPDAAPRGGTGQNETRPTEPRPETRAAGVERVDAVARECDETTANVDAMFSDFRAGGNADLDARTESVDRAMAEYGERDVLTRRAALAVEPSELCAMVRVAAMTMRPGDMTPDMLERLVQLQEQYQKEQRRIAFDKAMAEWRRIAPVLDRDRHVSFPSTKEDGGQVDYRHSSHGEMMSKVNEPLGKLGVNIKANPRVNFAAGFVELDITVTYQGHSETLTVPGEFDRSGNKSPIQAMSSAITRLTREGVRSALMLASRDDDDGHGAAGVTTITTEPARDEAEIARRTDEVAGLLAMIDTLSPGYRTRFLDKHSASYGPAANALGLAIPAAKLESLAGVLHGRLAAVRKAKDLAETES